MMVVDSNVRIRALGLVRNRKIDDLFTLINNVSGTAEVVSEENVELVRDVINTLCMTDQLNAAGQVVDKCPKQLKPRLKLDQVVDGILRRRRFEMASRAISMFGLLDECDVNLLHRFFSALVTKGQYRLAVDWARKLAEWEVKSQKQLPEFLRWTPSALVSAMVVAENYDQALKFIHELNLRNEFPVHDLIGRMLALSKFKQALDHIKRFGLEPEYPPLELMNGMLDAQQWEDAIKFADEVKPLWDHFPKEFIVERMIASRDYAAAITYIKRFQLDKKQGPSPPPALVELIRALIASSELNKAMKYVLKFDLKEHFPPERLIQNMIDMKQHEHALRHMRTLKLEHLFKDQMGRIQADRMAALRSFRAIAKRRAEAARLRKGLVGVSSSYSSSLSSLHSVMTDQVYKEVTWYKYPDTRIISAIPSKEEEPEFRKMMMMAMSNKQQQQQQHPNPSSSLSHHKQSNQFTSSSFDDTGEEIILLGGSNRNLNAKPPQPDKMQQFDRLLGIEPTKPMQQQQQLPQGYPYGPGPQQQQQQQQQQQSRQAFSSPAVMQMFQQHEIMQQQRPHTTQPPPSMPPNYPFPRGPPPPMQYQQPQQQQQAPPPMPMGSGGGYLPRYSPFMNDANNLPGMQLFNQQMGNMSLSEPSFMLPTMNDMAQDSFQQRSSQEPQQRQQQQQSSSTLMPSQVMMKRKKKSLP